jgi:hypothetical protein
MACGDLGVDIIPAVRAIGGEGDYRPVDPVEPRTRANDGCVESEVTRRHLALGGLV